MLVAARSKASRKRSYLSDLLLVRQTSMKMRIMKYSLGRRVADVPEENGLLLGARKLLRWLAPFDAAG